MAHKRYLMFVPMFRPIGGMKDLHKSYATIGLCVMALNRVAESLRDRVQIYDRIQGVSIDLKKLDCK